MNLKIDLNLDDAYTVADLDGEIATEVVRSIVGLREVLRLMGAPPHMVDSVISRISQERSIQINY